MSKSGKKANKNEGNKPESFIWSDDEVELLLNVTIEYKAAKSIENIDWESCQSKYGDILDRFVNQYPTPENATAIQKDFPHKKEQILQGTLASKLKMSVRNTGRQWTRGERAVMAVLCCCISNCARIYGADLLQRKR